jgi:hypothetical protein
MIECLLDTLQTSDEETEAEAKKHRGKDRTENRSLDDIEIVL